MPFRKRSDGGGYAGDAGVLEIVGLGAFARLSLPDHPPDELGLAAAYDDESDRIMVSIGGCTVSASPDDLALALELPLRPVGLADEVEAAAFSSAEAIAAVRGFVRDRVLLGCGEDVAAADLEVAAALRLIEQGKAYKADWRGLVWAVVREEVMAATPRRYAPYLLRLMESQRPELFAKVDGSLPPRKKLKGQVLQQCQGTGGMMLGTEYIVLGEEEDASLVCGGSQSIGDLEDMPIFGEGKDVAAPVDSNVAFIEGQEIHEPNHGNADHMIEIEDEDDAHVNVDVGLDIPPLRNAPLGTMPYVWQLQEMGAISNYQTISPFQVCTQQIQGYATAMDNGYLGMEKACRDTQNEVEHIKQLVMGKDHMIAVSMHDIKEELRARSVVLCPLEADMDLLCRSVQQYDKLLKRTFAELQEYMNNKVGGEGNTGGQNCAWVQQACDYHHQRISRIDQACFSSFLKLDERITQMETRMESLNHEVQRLKYSRSIPDLNNGIEDDGEGAASLRKTEDTSRTGEGGHVSNTTQGGEQLVELIAKPDQGNDTGESTGADGVQG